MTTYQLVVPTPSNNRACGSDPAVCQVDIYTEDGAWDGSLDLGAFVPDPDIADEIDRWRGSWTLGEGISDRWTAVVKRLEAMPEAVVKKAVGHERSANDTVFAASVTVPHGIAWGDRF